MHTLDLQDMVVQERYDIEDQWQSQVTHINTNANLQSVALSQNLATIVQVTKSTLTST